MQKDGRLETGGVHSLCDIGALPDVRRGYCAVENPKGASSPKAGCGGTVLNILENPEFNHQVDVTRGVLEKDCSDILKEFFTELRKRNKAEKEARKLAEAAEEQNS